MFGPTFHIWARREAAPRPLPPATSTENRRNNWVPHQNHTFSTSQLPKVLRTWDVLPFASKCASRHNDVQFLIAGSSFFFLSLLWLFPAFPSVHFAGSLTSKLQSLQYTIYFRIHRHRYLHVHISRVLRARPRRRRCDSSCRNSFKEKLGISRRSGHIIHPK